jgi:hypothetical protein
MFHNLMKTHLKLKDYVLCSEQSLVNILSMSLSTACKILCSWLTIVYNLSKSLQ